MNRTSCVLILSIAASGAALAVGCGSGSNDPYLVDNGFESDDPNGRSSSKSASPGASGGDTSGADAGTATPNDPNGGAQRTIQEADIIKVDGNRLYALSRYGGLSIVDITDPDHMKILGRKRTEGMPFEMYVQNGRAYVMLSDFGRYERWEGGAYGRWVQTSEIVALDVTNAASISEITHYDVPGSIADSRIVGDILYLVTFEDGYCWGCQDKPATIVSSFDVGGSIVNKVDQLLYTSTQKGYSAWKRSVTATTERMYIGGPEWNWTPGAQQARSIIQVVDISDPRGKLVKGADVPVAGQINSRWQMDEYNGVLRVVSQFGNGWWSPNGNSNPVVQTFTVASSQAVVPLGSTQIVMPMPEALQSVRFDGTRGYAITSQRKDPLFTIDLSDPAHPKQAGQVQMPGFVTFMEPRGDRLVGFGQAETTSNAGLAVSLFDVSDLTAPKMIQRVTFGSGWSTLAEDQDRVQKSVQVLDQQGMVLVPFASYGAWNNGACSQPQSGIQIIDYGHDTLALRGVAPQWGLPRRAILANNRLLAVSDRNVSSFDIASRDAPVKKNEIDLSNPAYRTTELANHVAAITNDWWSGEVQLALTPKANADDAQIAGKISLASLAPVNQYYCSGPSGWTAWYDARLFANGNFVYLTVPVYTYDQSTRSGRVIVAAIDVSNPAAPVIAGKSEIVLTTRNDWYTYYGFWDGWGYYSYYGGMYGSLVGAGEGVVRIGTKLTYLEVDNEPIKIDLGNGSYSYDVVVHRNLHVVDFANPAAPAVKAPVGLGASLGAAPLHVFGGQVLTTRWLPSSNPNKVRFYVDRVDLGGSDPVRLASINTPGSLVLADAASQRFVTADYSATRATATDWQSCQTALGWRAWFDYQTKACVAVDRSFALTDVAGSSVSLRQRFALPSQNMAGLVTAEDRVYVSRYPRYDYPSCTGNAPCQPNVLEDGGLWAIGGVRDGQLSIVSQMIGDSLWPLGAHGTKVALYTDSGLEVWDTSTPNAKLVADATLRGWGYTSYVLMNDERAICSLGDFGLQTVKY